MATVRVRVAPRSACTAVEFGPGGIVVRVRSAAEGGRATEEARRALCGGRWSASQRRHAAIGLARSHEGFEVHGQGPTSWNGASDAFEQVIVGFGCGC